MPTKTPVEKQPRVPATKTKLGPDQWPEWTQHLAKRKRPRPLSDLIATGSTSALQWPLHAEFAESESADIVHRLERFKPPKSTSNGSMARRVESWLEAAGGRAPSPLFGIECLAWAHALPRLARLLPAAPWCQLLEQLATVCHDAAGISVTEQPLTQQMLCGELPLTLAYLFPEIESCAALAAPARRALSDGIVELLDGEGLFNARHLRAMRPLLGCWTRCGYLGDAMPAGCFHEEAQAQYEWLVRESLRLTRYDGSQVLADHGSGRWEPSLMAAALKRVSSRKDATLAGQALPPGVELAVSRKPAGKKAAKQKTNKSKSKPKLPDPAIHSDWAGMAVLKRSWQREDPSLVLAYHEQSLALELNAGRELLWSGEWGFQARVDGQLLEPVDAWEEVCWVFDRDVAYVEVEAKLSNNWRLQRQLLLAREDQVLFVADALLGNRASAIDYQSTLPLASGMRFKPAEATHEGRLSGQRRVANLLPIGLPEWRSSRDTGSLEQTDQGLVLSQHAEGVRLFAPLFCDLNPRRFKKPLTWRHLTVAEHLEISAADEAVGYRVQIGKHQWLFYRSLGPAGNRTVLGQNFSAEFVAARFPASGEAEKLIEIE